MKDYIETVLSQCLAGFSSCVLWLGSPFNDLANCRFSEVHQLRGSFDIDSSFWDLSLKVCPALFLLSFDSRSYARTINPPWPVVPENLLKCLTVIHVPCHWTIYPVRWSWTLSLALFNHKSYPFSLFWLLIVFSFVHFIPFGTKSRNSLLFSTVLPQVVCHSTSCASNVISSSINNILRDYVVSFVPVCMYYFFFVDSCLFLWPLPLTRYLRLSHIGGSCLRRISFRGSRISLCLSPVFHFLTYQYPRGFALSVS